MSPSSDDLQGIGVNHPLAQTYKIDQATSHRGSSIDLDDEALDIANARVRKTPCSTTNGHQPALYNPAKSPLLLFQPHELESPYMIREPSPEDGCPRLPEASAPSPPSMTGPLPLQAYLNEAVKYENFVMKNHSLTAPEETSPASLKGKASMSRSLHTSSSSSSWVVINPDPAQITGLHEHPLQPTDRSNEPPALQLHNLESIADASISVPSMYPEFMSSDLSPSPSVDGGQTELSPDLEDQGLGTIVLEFHRSFDRGTDSSRIRRDAKVRMRASRKNRVQKR